MTSLFSDPDSAGLNHDADRENEHLYRYFGKYRAFVRDTDDPECRFRIRTFCPAVMGPTDDESHWLHWAEGCFPTGGSSDCGDVFCPQVNAGVWVEFEQGDPEHPIWSGCWYAGEDSDSSEAPNLGKGLGTKDASTQAPKGITTAQTYVVNETEGTADVGPAFEESPSQYATEYPNGRVLKTKAGHVLEFDDTEGEERIHIYHAAGTYVEINAAGGVTHKCLGSRHDIVVSRHVEHDNQRILVVDGPLGETVGGLVQQAYLDGIRRVVRKEVKEWLQSSMSQTIGAELTQSIGGARAVDVGASDTLNVLGALSRMVSGPFSLLSLENISLQAGNASGAKNAVNVTALKGDVSVTAVAGLINLTSLVKNIVMQATAGQVSISGAMGVTIGTGAVEPMVKGQKLATAGSTLATAASTLATTLAAVQLAGPTGPVPFAPAAAAFTSFASAFQSWATSVTAALSPLNKVG